MTMLGFSTLYLFQTKRVSLSLDDKISLTLAYDEILELTSGLGEKSANCSVFPFIPHISASISDEPSAAI